MTQFQVFKTSEATFEPFRTVGNGYQNVCEWIGQNTNAPYQAGIAELSHICIEDYKFSFHDFLYVLEGEIILTQEQRTETLSVGQAVYIPEGAIVTLDVPNYLLWIYVARSHQGHWKRGISTPGAVVERQ